MSSASDTMTKGRANLIMGSPFFGTLALRLKMRETDQVPTAATDGATLYYNPKFIDELSLPKVLGLIAHEVMHNAFLHHTRRGDRNPAKWNRACDYAINNILVKAGFDLPEGGCVDTKYENMTSEHIYSLLPDEPGDRGSVCIVISVGNGSDDQSGSGSGKSKTRSDKPQKDQPGSSDPGGDGAIMDSPKSQSAGASQSEQNEEESEWKIALASAVFAAQQAGRLPAGLERQMEELFENKLPWRQLLRAFMTEKCNDDFSWARGNRRFISSGLYLPSRTSDDAMGEMMVVIDTSGSISQSMLDSFGSEIAGIHSEVRPQKLHVVYCDAAVAHVDEFGPDDELHFKLHGGGGTDFRPPFEWAREHGVDPRCGVYLTDGYGPFPDDPVEYPFLWCIIDSSQVVPPWGEHLVLDM